jgi:Tfp pilus assembly protein PilN
VDLFPKDYKKNNILSSEPGKRPVSAMDFLKNLKNKFSFGGGSSVVFSRAKETLLRLGVVISGIALVLVLLLWGGLYFYARSLNNQISDLKKQQSEVFSAEDKILAQKIVDFDKGAILIQSLLKNHIYSSVIFDRLAVTTLPRVQWETFDLSVKNSEISLRGFSSDYATLARQLLALENDGFSNVRVSSISLDKTGGVTFLVAFNFDPRILQK